jgi:hypothetical protein
MLRRRQTNRELSSGPRPEVAATEAPLLLRRRLHSGSPAESSSTDNRHFHCALRREFLEDSQRWDFDSGFSPDYMQGGHYPYGLLAFSIDFGYGLEAATMLALAHRLAVAENLL